MALAPPAAAAGDPVSELAERYSPIVVIRDQPTSCEEGEPYLPAVVETVLGQPDVVLRGPQGEVVPAPTAADLAGRGDGWYLDLPGNPLAPECDYENWFNERSPQYAPTVYARIGTDPDHPGKLALQYWFWWVFNDWNDRHEGDWEMIQLLFDADSAEAALTTLPASAAFAQHEGSETAEWTDPKLLRVDDHVVVYPAQGSHAAYYTQAHWFGKSAAAGFGCDSTRAEGVEVRPEVVVLPDAPTGEFAWLDFTGRWGEKAPSFNNGPTGPNTKTQWTHPVSWQVEEGREGAVALPVVGGPAVDSFCDLTRAGSLLFIAALDSPVLVGVLVRRLRRAPRPADPGDALARTVGTPGRTGSGGPVRSSPPPSGSCSGGCDVLWPIVVVVGLANAGALALQRLVLHNRPSDDITDVNGLGRHAARPAGRAARRLRPRPARRDRAGRHEPSRRRHRARPPHLRLGGHRPRHPAPGGGGGAVGPAPGRHDPRVVAARPAGRPAAHRLLGGRDAGRGRSRGWASVAAFRRSARLTKGRRWRAVFLSTLLVWIGFSLPGALGGILLLLTGWPFWMSNVVAIVAGSVLLPFSAIGLTLQYYDFRQEEAARHRRRDRRRLEEPGSHVVDARAGRRSRARRTRCRGPRPAPGPGA